MLHLGRLLPITAPFSAFTDQLLGKVNSDDPEETIITPVNEKGYRPLPERVRGGRLRAALVRDENGGDTVFIPARLPAFSFAVPAFDELETKLHHLPIGEELFLQMYRDNLQVIPVEDCPSLLAPPPLVLGFRIRRGVVRSVDNSGSIPLSASLPLLLARLVAPLDATENEIERRKIVTWRHYWPSFYLLAYWSLTS